MNTLHNQHMMRTLIENRQNDLLKEAQVLRLTSGNNQPDDTSQTEHLNE